MIKNFKTVSMLLFLGAMSTGIANAAADMGVAGTNIVQQGSVCKGIVKDATGETVIGASVVVKGTTNGTITGLDGDFELSNVEKRSNNPDFICRIHNSGSCMERTASQCSIEG